MSDLRICRICVTTGTKMYRLERFHLRNYYEELTASKIYIGDNLPKYFCYECAMMLHKFHKFKEKCFSGQRVLMEVLWQGLITYKNVSKIDRRLRNIESILQIMTESKRIKHYNIIYNEDLYIKTEDDMEEVKEVFIEENSYFEHYPMTIDTTAIDATAIDATAIDATDIDATDIDATDIDATDIDATDIDATDIDATDIDATAINTAAVDIAVIETIDKDREKDRDKKKKYKRKNGATETLETEGVYNSTYKGDKYLSDDKWKKHKLTEEDAMKEFSVRAKTSGYLKASYKCTDCYTGFSKKEMLTRHVLLRHDKSFPYECRFCKMRFKSKSPRTIHMRHHFTKYQCLQCNFVCTRENLALQHLDYHSGVKMKCLHCSRLFRHQSSYYSHMRKSHRSEYICAICGASFVSEIGLHQHKRFKHITVDIDNADDRDDNTYCDRCGIKFMTKKAYQVHLFHSALHAEQKVQDKVSPKKITRKRVRKREPTDVDEPKTVRSKVRKGRFKTKPTTCYQCGQHFQTQKACRKHHQREHPGTSFTSPTARHICALCGVSLAPGSIASHNNMHTREKLYSCDGCEKTFYNNAALTRHRVTHTGEKPFACTLCDKRFTQSNSRKLHYRTYHLKEPYPKRVCKKKQ